MQRYMPRWRAKNLQNTCLDVNFKKIWSYVRTYSIFFDKKSKLKKMWIGVLFQHVPCIGGYFWKGQLAYMRCDDNIRPECNEHFPTSLLSWKCDELCKQWRKNSHGSISFDGFVSRICLMGTRNVCGSILIMDNLILYLNIELTFINFSNTHKYNHQYYPISCRYRITTYIC